MLNQGLLERAIATLPPRLTARRWHFQRPDGSWLHCTVGWLDVVYHQSVGTLFCQGEQGVTECVSLAYGITTASLKELEGLNDITPRGQRRIRAMRTALQQLLRDAKQAEAPARGDVLVQTAVLVNAIEEKDAVSV